MVQFVVAVAYTAVQSRPSGWKTQVGGLDLRRGCRRIARMCLAGDRRRAVSWCRAGMQEHSSTPTDVGQLLVHLEQRLVELERLHQEITRDAQALGRAVSAQPGTVAAPSVYSVREAAAELGVSVSMLHKLLKQGRLGHLKVGARTLITVEHLAQFRADAEVASPGQASGEMPPTPTVNDADRGWTKVGAP